MPFGASISCALFQHFSNAIKHLVEAFTGRPTSVTNFLDDFLLVAPSKHQCDHMVRTFIYVTERIGLTVAEEKTEWGTTRLTFLEILMLGDKLLLSIPEDKRIKALNMAKLLADCRKATIHELQKFTGFLNFLCRAIYPGRAFTRRMYNQIPWLDSCGKPMKQHYHINLTQEFKDDCKVWIKFLDADIPVAVCRPFIDFSISKTATELDFYMDSSANELLGNQWFAGAWPLGFVRHCHPSIEYLELYAVTVAIVLWSKYLINSRVIVFVDNQSSMRMLNKSASPCKNCMVLIRIVM